VADLDTKNGVGTDEKGRTIRLRNLLGMVECTDANGNTPLSEASGGGHPSAIKMLIENGASLNSRVRSRGYAEKRAVERVMYDLVSPVALVSNRAA
ncbi:UNVERIFIED_CONTAM: hypothetical protein K2H54_000542, partial [Gekko kuhli]